ncbi:armadillo repeat-containing protein 8 isoform X2 [Herrania umbratica]|uniref:Armadillo repeat-containing protein 8 isoform X2 n=1 Tax=Herrania umbratica TaxID=108875 RepID=A0A6J0ZYL9_9ROSI|nr:armadillo repeat-containing protein 8 isoform X2 [Herrania umbratica]
MPSATVNNHRPSELLSRLASAEPEVKLRALREVKNQIIGNRTKKLSFIKLGAVPAVAGILADSADDVIDYNNNNCNVNNNINNILVQSAAALGSFACGFDAGVQAVLDAGAFPNLLRLLSNSNQKVVDAGARALRMIYQSKLVPKYDFLQQKNMEFLISLLNSENENVSGLGASIITHSCETSLEQKVLFDAGILRRLNSLLEGGSLSQRYSSLESLASIFKNNSELVSKFAGAEIERPLGSIIDLLKDRYPRTRLLACMCLIVIRNTSPHLLQDIGVKSKLIHILLELLDDPGQVGDEASFAFSSLIAQKEDLQKLALEANAIDKLHHHLQKGSLRPRRYEGILLALADMCSKLESCRSKFLSLQVLNLVTDALTDDSADVRTAACICLKSVTRSIKVCNVGNSFAVLVLIFNANIAYEMPIQNLSAGYFMNEMVVVPLVQLFLDPSTSVQVAALGAISNVVVDFTTHKCIFVQCGGMKQLVQLATSMESAVRSNALWALKNFVFLADNRLKEGVFSELTASLLSSLIYPEPSVQEQALALVRNLVDGCMNSVEFMFAEDGLILGAIGRQLQNASKAEIGIQGMYALCNVASGNEFHKEAVMHQLFPQMVDKNESFMINFLQSNDSQLRTATVWTIVNLTCPSSPGAFGRLVKLRNAGIVSQIKHMVNDPCVDVKFRVRTVLGQSMAFGDN